MDKFIVIAPQEAQVRERVGAYAEQYGWLVKNTETGHVAYSTNQREARRIARSLNRHAQDGC